MSLILGLNYIIFIIITIFWIVKDRRNSKKNKEINKNIAMNPRDKKIALLIVLSTMFTYYVIGYILKTDILNAVTLRISVLVL